MRANKAFGLCLSKTILVLSDLGKVLLSSIISDKANNNSGQVLRNVRTQGPRL